MKAKHALDAFNGEGARLYGGHRNTVGTPMVYAAQSRALAATETLVHAADADRRIQYVMYEIEIPDELILIFDKKKLPADWQSLSPPPSVQAIGSVWQESLQSPALLVPSVMIQEECCILLNPEHPDTKAIQIHYPTPFEFDGRLNLNTLRTEAHHR